MMSLFPAGSRPSLVLPSRVTTAFTLLGLASTALAQAAGTPQEVTFRGGQLTVHANNSTLPDLLRQISNATGMRITGRAPDDHVFGTYGPGDPQVIIATLLEGTRTNVLILSNTIDCPLQLLLTPRTGAASPPSAFAAQRASDEDPDPPPFAQPGNPDFRQQQRSIPTSPPQGQPGSSQAIGAPAADPAATQPSSSTQQVVFPPIGDGSTPSTATTTPADSTSTTDSNNAPKTPEQIFNQLQKLRQQNNAEGAGTTGGSQQ